MARCTLHVYNNIIVEPSMAQGPSDTRALYVTPRYNGRCTCNKNLVGIIF